MTVPAPRGAEAGGGQEETTTVLGILVATTRRIEDTVARGFDNVNLQLSRLPETYVARREFDRYRDERTVEWADAKRQHDKDIDELRAKDEERHRQAVTLRRSLIGGGVAAVIGIAADIIAAISLHH